jgi:hypothetical protein
MNDAKLNSIVFIVYVAIIAALVVALVVTLT